MAIELEKEGIKVNAVSPGFTKTNLNGYAGTETVEEGAREALRVALLGADGPTGTFTRWKTGTIPWWCERCTDVRFANYSNAFNGNSDNSQPFCSLRFLTEFRFV
jgi:NAD(P)-dependent dehydrogenase (short-subunit alcohol dehydrogenase family)